MSSERAGFEIGKDGLEALAEELRADCIVIGRSHDGAGTLGSVARTLINLATRPVVVAPVSRAENLLPNSGAQAAPRRVVVSPGRSSATGTSSALRGTAWITGLGHRISGAGH